MRQLALILSACATLAAPAAACRHTVGIPVSACPSCQASVSAVSVGQVETSVTVAVPTTTTVTLPATVAVPLYTQSETVSLPVATSVYGVSNVGVGLPLSSATAGVYGGSVGVTNVGIVGGSYGGNAGVVGIPVGVQRGVGFPIGRGRFRSKAVSKVKTRGRF